MPTPASAGLPSPFAGFQTNANAATMMTPTSASSSPSDTNLIPPAQDKMHQTQNWVRHVKPLGCTNKSAPHQRRVRCVTPHACTNKSVPRQRRVRCVTPQGVPTSPRPTTPNLPAAPPPRLSIGRASTPTRPFPTLAPPPRCTPGLRLDSREPWTLRHSRW